MELAPHVVARVVAYWIQSEAPASCEGNGLLNRVSQVRFLPGAPLPAKMPGGMSAEDSSGGASTNTVARSGCRRGSLGFVPSRAIPRLSRSPSRHPSTHPGVVLSRPRPAVTSERWPPVN